MLFCRAQIPEITLLGGKAGPRRATYLQGDHEESVRIRPGQHRGSGGGRRQPRRPGAADQGLVRPERLRACRRKNRPWAERWPS